MGTNYETDVIVWAQEQVALLRSGKLTEIDIVHIAEEIADVGRAEQRELANRMSILLAHLLKWKYQPDKRTNSWEITIRNQRTSILKRLIKTPSLKPMLNDPDWIEDVWADAIQTASKETAIEVADFSLRCPWTMTDAITPDWMPDQRNENTK